MISQEHKLYLKKQRRKQYGIHIAQVSIFLLFFIGWQLLADFKLINTFITSSPKEIIETIISLYKANNLYHHIWITIYETIVSFSFGTILGCLIATILWWFKTLHKIVDPYLTILNSLPKVALGPIIIIWCGANMKSIITMALLISVIVTIINVSDSFNHVDNDKIKLMKSFQAKKIHIFLKLVVPSSFKSFISTLKVNTSLTLIGVIMGEYLVSKEGIGYLIMYGSQVFNLNLVMTGIFLLGILSAIMYYIVFYFEKRLNK